MLLKGKIKLQRNESMVFEALLYCAFMACGQAPFSRDFKLVICVERFHG